MSQLPIGAGLSLDQHCGPGHGLSVEQLGCTPLDGMASGEPSFTSHREWIVHMPLAQVIFAWVTTKFGVLALKLFSILVFCAALILIWLPHARSPVARLVT